MVKSLLFDMDGVLIDAREWHYEALNRALWDIAQYRISKEDHLSVFDGLPTKVKLVMLGERGVLKEAQHEAVFRLKQRHTMNIIKQNCKPDPVKIDMMHKLHAYKKACVTNSIYKTTYEMLVHSGLNYYMDYVQGNEATAFAKPNPSPYLKAMSVLGIEPKETLIIEDSDTGYTAAVKSGAFVEQLDYPDVTFESVMEAIRRVDEVH